MNYIKPVTVIALTIVIAGFFVWDIMWMSEVLENNSSGSLPDVSAIEKRSAGGNSALRNQSLAGRNINNDIPAARKTSRTSEDDHGTSPSEKQVRTSSGTRTFPSGNTTEKPASYSQSELTHDPEGGATRTEEGYQGAEPANSKTRTVTQNKESSQPGIKSWRVQRTYKRPPSPRFGNKMRASAENTKQHPTSTSAQQ